MDRQIDIKEKIAYLKTKFTEDELKDIVTDIVGIVIIELAIKTYDEDHGEIIDGTIH